mmetsp:Transcript_64380/g.121970  ORF Transcript_64380/g.121970 Transcript_64380/m.121970 type:complete len:1109 (-) Transcript_64380:50-3376(-)
MLVHRSARFSVVFLLSLTAQNCGNIGAAADIPGNGSCRSGTHQAAVLLQTKTLSLKTKFSSALDEAQDVEQISYADYSSTDQADDLPKECWVLPKRLKGSKDLEKVPHRRVLLSAECPLQCPFSQMLAGDPCFKACVRGGNRGCAQLHPLRSFPNPATLSCEQPCGSGNTSLRVVGCAECAGQGLCRRCMMGYDLKDDGRRCENKLQIVWQVVYVLLFLALGIVATYAVTLCCRPVSNKAMLARAELHQELSRPWMLETSEQVTRQKYPLLQTHVHEKDISGLGVLLYFRWLRFLVFVGFVLLTATSLAWFVALRPVDPDSLAKHIASVRNTSWSRFRNRHLTLRAQACPNETRPTLIDEGLIEEFDSESEQPVSQLNTSLMEWWFKPKTRKVSGGNRRGRATGQSGDGDSSDMLRPAGDPRKYPERMFLALTIAYAVIILSSLAFASHQARLKTRRDDFRLIHGDFALRVDGLPASATGAAELKAFFQSILNEAAAGMENVARPRLYKIEGVSIAFNFHEHQKVISAALDHFVEDIEAEYPCMSTFQVASNTDGDAAAGIAPVGGGRRRLQAPCRVVDSLIVPDLNMTPNKHWKEEVRPVLESLEGCGIAYVVTSSKLAAERLLLLQSARYWTGEELTFRAVRAEPPDILWANMGKKVTWREVASSIRLMVLTIFGWMLFYVPYAMHYTDLTRAPEEETTFMQDIFLGLLISAGNQMVGAASDVAADNCAFLEKDKRDVVVLFLAFVSTFANTVCDIGMVLIIARSVSLDSAIIGMRLEGGYDRALARELMSLLVPGYLIMPHVMAPIFEYVIPVYANRLIVGSTPGVARGVAEQALMCPDFDINWRYVDVLTNFMVCLMMVFFATPNTWRIMVFLMLFILLIYVMDHYKLLRQTSQTFYTTDALSIAFTYCWGLPTACLAATAAWWGSRSGMVHMSEQAAVGLVVPLHCIVYVFAVSLVLAVVPAPHGQSDLLYEEMVHQMRQQGKAYDFFNTNPVHVLREYLLHEGERPLSDLNCVPYSRGKEYLQMDVHSLRRSRSLGTTAAEVFDKLACHARLATKPVSPVAHSVNQLLGTWRHAAHRMSPMLRTVGAMQGHHDSTQDAPRSS